MMSKNSKDNEQQRKSYVGLTGAELFHQMLLEEGVEIMFGIPGGALLPIFDCLYESPIKFVLTRHEQGAAHMADGYARSTGKVGVCALLPADPVQRTW